MHKSILALLAIATLTLTGCHLFTVYQPDVQQGNVYTPAQVGQLKPGMSKAQVQQVMGTPVLRNTFSNNVWNYVYTFASNGGEPTIEKHVTVYFRNNTVTRIAKS